MSRTGCPKSCGWPTGSRSSATASGSGVFRRGEIIASRDRQADGEGRRRRRRSAPRARVETRVRPRQGRCGSRESLVRPAISEHISIDCEARTDRRHRRRPGLGHGHFLRAVAGVDEPDEGEILLDGHALPLGSVRQAVRQRHTLVPADRRGAAIVPSLSVRANLASATNIRAQCARFGLRWPGHEREMAAALYRSLQRSASLIRKRGSAR